MSDAAGTYSDASTPIDFGTQTLTIGTLTGAVAEDISVDDDTNVLTRKNQVGVPDGEVQIDGVMTGTASIQVRGTMPLPPKGTPFTLTDVTGTTFGFKVNKWGRKWKNDGMTMVNLTFRQRFATGS